MLLAVGSPNKGRIYLYFIVLDLAGLNPPLSFHYSFMHHVKQQAVTRIQGSVRNLVAAPTIPNFNGHAFLEWIATTLLQPFPES